MLVDNNSQGGRRAVSITGIMRTNRAMDGDVVAVELLSGPTATASSSSSSTSTSVQHRNEGDAADIAQETLEASVAQQEGLSQSDPPLSGRVVGVIKRMWGQRQYAGSLDMDTSVEGGDGGGVNVQFVAVDKKVGRVWVTTRRLQDLANCRVLVAIDQWPAASVTNYLNK